eukprot:scaffold175669_cov19-Tisochrysis_lutea.AAC.1
MPPQLFHHGASRTHAALHSTLCHCPIHASVSRKTRTKCQARDSPVMGSVSRVCIASYKLKLACVSYCRRGSPIGHNSSATAVPEQSSHTPGTSADNLARACNRNRAAIDGLVLNNRAAICLAPHQTTWQISTNRAGIDN